ncbi:MAG: nucleotidyltransferase [Deltaproteobacteria bacterium]|nr:nucleotidyltransferase [Deltaproteobacteria bacterium]
MARRGTAAESALAVVLQKVDEAYLWPQPEAVADAKQRADRLIRELDQGRAWMFQVLRVHEHGSLGRGTALRDFKDLDRLIELDPLALHTRSGQFRSARDTIRRMAKHIADRRAGLVTMGAITVRAQDHSVGIWYPGSELRIDLVPAVTSQGAVYIPELGTGDWIRTDPAATAARLGRAKRAAPHTDTAVRLLKGWARARGRNAPIASFAVETWVVDAVLKRPKPLDELVASFFDDIGSTHAGRHLALGSSGFARCAVTLLDPVSGNNLTQDLQRQHRTTLVKSCRTAAIELARIAALARDGQLTQAVTAGKRLFVGRTWG